MSEVDQPQDAIDHGVADGDEGVLHTQHLLLAAGAGVTGSRLKYADLYDFFAGSGVRTALTAAAGIAGAVSSSMA